MLSRRTPRQGRRPGYGLAVLPQHERVSRFVAACLPAMWMLTVGPGYAASWPLGSWSAEYDKRGLFLESADGRFALHPQLRFQTRYSNPFDADPRSVEAVENPPGGDLRLQRSRIKLGGHAFAPWLKFYTEMEFRDTRLLDLRLSLEKFRTVNLRIGQWKPEYNRERRDSSGTLQFAERSIVNRPFTLDRQPGAMLYGRLFPGTRHDLSWWTGLFTGSGRSTRPDGGRPLWLARLQWNLFGRVLEFSQSDVTWRAEPAASLAIAYAQNRSRYTRFSSAGGGELDGFSEGEDDQYALRQAMVEAALQWQGLSFQAELHGKRVRDRLNGGTTKLWGSYLQAGLFPGRFFPKVPAPLELAVRAAAVDPDTSEGNDMQHELTAAANWFFNGHRNKLTFDVSWIQVDEPGDSASDVRFRFQWDVSF